MTWTERPAWLPRRDPGCAVEISRRTRSIPYNHTRKSSHQRHHWPQCDAKVGVAWSNWRYTLRHLPELSGTLIRGRAAGDQLLTVGPEGADSPADAADKNYGKKGHPGGQVFSA